MVALTPDRLNLLVLHGSPVSEGGSCSRAQLLLALWILSPGFVVGVPFRFALFRARWWFISHSPHWRAAVRDSLQHWHRLQFIDRPVQDRGNTVESDPPERWLAGFVLTCMKRLEMPEHVVRRTPYARLLQYLSELDERRIGAGDPGCDEAVNLPTFGEMRFEGVPHLQPPAQCLIARFRHQAVDIIGQRHEAGFAAVLGENLPG